MSTQRYFISIDDLPRARGESHELSFHGGSPESFAALFQDALRTPSLWQPYCLSAIFLNSVFMCWHP